MDLHFTPEQEGRRLELRALLAEQAPIHNVAEIEASETGYSQELWDRLAADDWLAGAPLLDLTLRFEELGRAATPGPFLAHFESLLLLEELGAHSRLERTARRGQHNTLAWLETAGSPDPRATALSADPTPAVFELHGAKLFVPWAETADLLLVVLRSSPPDRLGAADALAVIAIDADRPEVERIPLASLGAERLFELRFRGARVLQADWVDANAGPALERALAHASLLACAELAGAAASALELAVSHAREREQFGQPIGAFQAVAHHCANMAMDVDAARLAVWDAASRIDAEESPEPLAARAKLVCSEAARRVTTTAHQVVGGVGFLAESPLHLFTRRVKALESRLGAPDWQRERIADELGL